MNLSSIVAVGAGGAIGSILRYLVGFVFVQRFGAGFPWGTLFINVSGSFLIGLVSEVSIGRSLGIAPFLRILLAVGVLGGYTTFSTFSLDALTLLGERTSLAFGYALGSVLLGVLAAFGGIAAARMLGAAH